MSKRSQKAWIESVKRRKTAGLTWRRKMTGFFATLTAEQQVMALAYDGPEDFGDPTYLIGATPTE